MKEKILNQFTLVTEELLELLSSLSEEDLNRLPFEGSWTAAQVGDHLYKSYAVSKILNGSVKKTNRPPDQKVEEVKALFLDFNIKMKSPPVIVPSKSTIGKTWLLDSLKSRIEEQKEVINTKDLTETCLEFAIPEYGNFTRMEWIFFNIVHTQRHVRQLKNIIVKLK